MLELSTYEGIPHLLCQLLQAKERNCLGWVIKKWKIDTVNDKVGVRNIGGYNLNTNYLCLTL